MTIHLYFDHAFIGRRYSVEAGNLRIEGWRLTRRWARAAAKRRARKLELADDGRSIKGS